MDILTIEKLIVQGKEILSGIKPVPSHPNVIRTYSAYQLADVSVYERWKNVVLRFLESYTVIPASMVAVLGGM